MNRNPQAARCKLHIIFNHKNTTALPSKAAPRASMVKKKKLTAPERDRVMSRLIGQSDLDPNWQRHFSKSDVVIEAVFEDMALKHKIIQVLLLLLRWWR